MTKIKVHIHAYFFKFLSLSVPLSLTRCKKHTHTHTHTHPPPPHTHTHTKKKPSIRLLLGTEDACNFEDSIFPQSFKCFTTFSIYKISACLRTNLHYELCCCDHKHVNTINIVKTQDQGDCCRPTCRSSHRPKQDISAKSR